MEGIVKGKWKKSVLRANILKFRTNIGYFIHNHSLSLLRGLLCTVNILSHQALTNAQPAPNGCCVKFRMRKKDQRYSCRFWIVIFKTLKRNIFIKGIPMYPLVIHLIVLPLYGGCMQQSPII